MSAHFAISKSTNGEFHFHLSAGNGEIILSSQMYGTKAAAEGGISSVQANCSDDVRYDRMMSSIDQPYFTLKAANHQVIGTSQMYASTSSRDTGIASVKSNGTTTDIRDKS